MDKGVFKKIFSYYFKNKNFKDYYIKYQFKEKIKKNHVKFLSFSSLNNF